MIIPPPKSTPITLLDAPNCRILKMFEVVGPSWNRFRGFFIYKRKLTKNYNYKHPDLLDQTIEKALINHFSHVRLMINQEVYIKGQMESILNPYSSGNIVDFNIILRPSIPPLKRLNLTSLYLYEYDFYFKLILTSPPKEEFTWIPVESINYPYEKMEEIHTNYKNIDFSFL